MNKSLHIQAVDRAAPHLLYEMYHILIQGYAHAETFYHEPAGGSKLNIGAHFISKGDR